MHDVGYLGIDVDSTTAMLVLIVFLAGRPTGEGRAAGILWGPAHSFNNIRTWIDPHPLTGDEFRTPDL